jgi:hypothetical protein
MKRRSFLRNAALATTSALVPIHAQSAAAKGKDEFFSYEEENLISKPGSQTVQLEGKLQKGKIKNVELSRMMIGGNLVSGFAHARDLVYVSKLMTTYFTDEKVIETLAISEAAGINTAVLRCDEHILRILNKYRKQGGKIQWLAQTYPKSNDLTNIKMAVDNGAIGAFVMGNNAEQFLNANKIDDLAKSIEYIQSQGIIGGTAGHTIKVPITCVENGIKPDFFMKTYHSNSYWTASPIDPADPELPKVSHDNMWCASAEKVEEFFRTNTTPWLAYKVLAAGAIRPKVGFRQAFESGADFIVVGMFDFQVVENVNITTGILGSDLKRERKWYA